MIYSSGNFSYHTGSENRKEQIKSEGNVTKCVVIHHRTGLHSPLMLLGTELPPRDIVMAAFRAASSSSSIGSDVSMGTGAASVGYY